MYQFSFSSDQTYTLIEINQIADSVEMWTNEDEPDPWLIAQVDSQSREYWFKSTSNGWKLSHTWSAFALVGNEPE